MTRDPVPNVRLRLVRFFPALAVKWKHSVEFADALRMLTSDVDPQVALEARVQLKALPQTPSLTADQIVRDRKLETTENQFFITKKKKGTTVVSTGNNMPTIGGGGGGGGREKDNRTNGNVGGIKSPPQAQESHRHGPSPVSVHPPFSVAAANAPPLNDSAAHTKLAGAQNLTTEPTPRQSAGPVKKGLCGCFG
jgi:hypothetical protein